jgi:hypothetical protein
MARPMTTEAVAATQAAKTLAETRERKQHMAQLDLQTPTNKPPVEPALPSLDPTAGQA